VRIPRRCNGPSSCSCRTSWETRSSGSAAARLRTLRSRCSIPAQRPSRNRGRGNRRKMRCSRRRAHALRQQVSSSEGDDIWHMKSIRTGYIGQADDGCARDERTGAGWQPSTRQERLGSLAKRRSRWATLASFCQNQLPGCTVAHPHL
jgi:hypothetical protein